MPEWGFTEGQRTLQEPPWGLPSRLLAPGKVYTDPVHGDIYLTVLEQWLVDTWPFQRLRRVRQLGTTHLVYPGATHSRFSHALGAVRVVQNLLDAVISQRDGLHAVEDRFAQWQSEGPAVLNHHIARATVLARLGALLHDLCHVPVGHSVEDDLKVLVEHDRNDERFTRLWAGVATAVNNRIDEMHGVDAPERAALKEGLKTLLDPNGELHTELKPLVISKGSGVKRHEEMVYPFAADLVGNTICADLLDYLLRDHLFTGLPVSLGHRFLSGFFVVPKGHGVYSERVALNVMRGGHERADVVSELLKALRYRYELSERALVHHAKLSADAIVGKALEYWSQALWLERAADAVVGVDDHQARLDADDVLGLRNRVRENLPPAKFAQLESEVSSELEDEFLSHGDDGLFERMLRLGAEEVADARVAPTAGRLLTRAAGFAGRILTRDLYVVAGRASAADAPADELIARYGDAEARSRLERSAAEFAELNHPSHVLLWLPGREMRLKLAYVLVHDGSTVKPFVDYERSGRQRGSDIYDAHRGLWAMWVFVDRAVSAGQRETVLAFLASHLGVRWERMDDFGPHPADWLTKLAVSEARGLALPSREVDEMVERLPDFAARGEKTYSDYLAAVKEALA